MMVASEFEIGQVVILAGVELQSHLIRVTEVGMRGKLPVAPGRMFPAAASSRDQRAAGGWRRGQTHGFFDHG